MDELLKFRSLLASVAKVELNSSSKANDKSSSTKSTVPMKGVLTESFNNQPSSTTRQNIAPEPIIKNQWEDDMLNRYTDLFQFPIKSNINDRTMILLILAYQMNTIRCWCELQDGALAKVKISSMHYIPCNLTSFFLKKKK